MSETSGILARIEGAAGRLTLDRPAALNALTLAMIEVMDGCLREWQHNPAVKLVIVDATGGRAFCAGGDVQALYQAMGAGDFDGAQQFFAREYRLNALIANYPKPYVALMHGIVIGGGVGVSAHGSRRIVTEQTLLALPECSIGLIPDVGTSHLLARAPGHLGEYIGLTGARLGPAAAIEAGFADVHVAASRLGELTDDLTATGDVGRIDAFATAPDRSVRPLPNRSQIDDILGAPTLSEIMERLAACPAEWAKAGLRFMMASAPLSLCCALAAIRQARIAGTIEAALNLEYGFASRAIRLGDFREGIRAAVIDRDRQPRWTHTAVSDVSDMAVAAMLAPADEQINLA